MTLFKNGSADRVHARDSETAPYAHKRHDDTMIAFFVRKVAPWVLAGCSALGAYAWSEGFSAYHRIPTAEQLAERQKLIAEFRGTQNEVATLKMEIARDRDISNAQREEIVARLKRVEDKMDLYYERIIKAVR